MESFRFSRKQGRVYLVGAGPGDIGLITVRGVDCLRMADIVVYDYLANESLLWHAAAAELVYVGKAAGQHTMSQEDINQLLVDYASQGKQVVRLKGGDPFVFGRGGEEALALADAGIPFEIVPGVSSAIAAPAYAGIPVTHRGTASSLHLVTGHEEPGKDSSAIEWDVLAKTRGTLVFLMGAGNLPQIARELMSRGKPESTPVAVVRWGTLPEQETLVTTLGCCEADAAKHNLTPPAVLLVGEVAALHRKLHWAEQQKPLLHVRAAVTRPADQSRELAALLHDAGADVAITPTIRIQQRKLSPLARKAIEEVQQYSWIVFTSANGVRIFFSYLYEMGLDGRALAKARIAAIGDKTADTLRDFGIVADCVPREFSQEGLAAELRISSGDRVLIPRAAVAREALTEELQAQGARTDVIPVYDTLADPAGIDTLRRKLEQGRIHLVTFTSSSTVEHLVGAVGRDEFTRLLRPVKVASIGPVTTRTLEHAGIAPAIEAKRYNAAGLADAIIDHYLTTGKQKV